MMDIHLSEYELLNGSKKTLVRQVGDGSIIKRFEATPPPRTSTDIVCPHFLELKWAIGCPFDCAWCYLRGTLRHYERGKNPTWKNYNRIKAHIFRFFRCPGEGEILNSGEIADSLMGEFLPIPFSKFITPIFEAQDKHKILFLTKGGPTYVKNLVEINPHKQVIMSFSLNSITVAKKWELAPPIMERIKAASIVHEAGYETRIRIDPIVPYPSSGWKANYQELIDRIFNSFTPERITLGSLRGLQSTINEAKDKSWVDYLSEPSKWGKRILTSLRFEAFRTLLEYLQKEYGYDNVALCKEPREMWGKLGLYWTQCRCNCIW